ncbi:hypothetical protein VTK73DRAFT_8738 [Phialemonium thermophilum]|uniref:EKC/KEOPS complex subunit BUD32 n=1 Tax=Phialemonium thermophilum TaxID=223376 RepID=A0ABR3W6K4_9PEZI
MQDPPAAGPEMLGSGCSGFVSVDSRDPRLVLKSYEVWHNGRCCYRFEPVDHGRACLEREAKVYQRLGSHPAILEYHGEVYIADEVLALKLERAQGDLRTLMKNQSPPSHEARLEMAMQIASGMAHMHRRGVFHCDFSCRNLFVTGPGKVKIGDFGGSKLGDEEPLGAEEVRYELPLRGREWEERSYGRRELFALGCAIYEIMAWKMPFAELGEAEVEENYAREVFPELDGIAAGQIIEGCWKEEFPSAEDVLAALREAQSTAP